MKWSGRRYVQKPLALSGPRHCTDTLSSPMNFCPSVATMVRVVAAAAVNGY